MTAAVPCPLNASGVILAYEHYVTGTYSDMDISRLLNDLGYRIKGRLGNTVITRQTVQEILQNRFYIGETSYGSRGNRKLREWHPGNQEPLVSHELFDRCQQVRKQRADVYTHGQPTLERAEYLLSSLLYCTDCGATWKGWKLRGGRRYRDGSYDLGRTCASPVKSAAADDLEGQIQGLVLELQIPSDWEKRILRSTQDSSDAQAIEHERLRQTLSSQLERLKQLYLLGDIDEQEYSSGKAGLQQRIASLAPRRSISLSEVKAVAQSIPSIQALWHSATFSEKQQWLRMLFRRIYVKEGVVRAVEATELMWFLFNGLMIPDSGSNQV